MEKRTSSPFPKFDRPVLAAIGLVLVGATVFFAWSDRQHDYRYYQYTFKGLVAEKFGADRAATVPSGLQQVWVPGLRRADRCTTCHQAVSWKGFESAEEPYRTHPIELLKSHPVERFGCSACHGGQGWAIDTYAAHGEVAHWEEPLLGKPLGEAYSLADNKAALMQMNCNICHRYERETKGAEMINRAKALVQEKGHAPSAEDVAARMNMPVLQVQKILRIARAPISLETPIGAEEDSHLGDFIEDKDSFSPVDRLISADLKEKIEEALQQHTEREAGILRMRFGLGDGHEHTLEEVGQEYRVTRERIRQIQDRAIQKIKNSPHSRKLKSFSK